MLYKIYVCVKWILKTKVGLRGGLVHPVKKSVDAVQSPSMPEYTSGTLVMMKRTAVKRHNVCMLQLQWVCYGYILPSQDVTGSHS